MKLSPIRWFFSISALLVLGFLLIQLIPLGKDHTNPPVKFQQEWEAPKTEQLVRGACYDCHSNETTWPWYSNVAPASWLVYYDVQKGRSALNLSELSPEQASFYVNLMIEKVENNKMPPFQYNVIHAEGRFSSAEKQELVNGLTATFK